MIWWSFQADKDSPINVNYILINSVSGDLNGHNVWRTWNSAVAGPFWVNMILCIIDVQQFPDEMEYFALLFVIEKIWWWLLSMSSLILPVKSRSMYEENETTSMVQQQHAFCSDSPIKCNP